jgi:predicted ester cyclase
MTEERARHVATTIIEEGWNKGRLEVLDELVAENYTRRGPDVTLNSRDEWKQWIGAVRALFPDFHVEIHDIIATSDRSAVRFTATATHTSPYFEIEPTGKKVKFEGMVMVRLEDGILVEEWEVTDRLPAFNELTAAAAEQRAATPH